MQGKRFCVCERFFKEVFLGGIKVHACHELIREDAAAVISKSE